MGFDGCVPSRFGSRFCLTQEYSVSSKCSLTAEADTFGQRPRGCRSCDRYREHFSHTAAWEGKHSLILEESGGREHDRWTSKLLGTGGGTSRCSSVATSGSGELQVDAHAPHHTPRTLSAKPVRDPSPSNPRPQRKFSAHHWTRRAMSGFSRWTQTGLLPPATTSHSDTAPL